MKKLILAIGILSIAGCGNQQHIPDVSSIEVPLKLIRFDKEFFSLDTVHIAESMDSLWQKYPQFTPDFVVNILGLDIDSVMVSGSPESDAVRRFIHDYLPMEKAVEQQYGDFSREQNEIHQALRYVKYYFPNYPLPKNVITFVGPLNATFETSFGVQGDILTLQGFGIGMQLHLGKDFSFYQTDVAQSLYPEYISRNFDRDHITVNCMRVIVDDLFPASTVGRPLIEQMVQNGRKLYLLTRFLPRTKDYVLMGYTPKQMKAANANEGIIWSFFLKNNLLNSAEQNLIKNYIGESPKTQEFGDDAPGNLGSFAGLQIVRKFMDKFPETTLDELMKLDPRDIYSRSKYKPRN